MKALTALRNSNRFSRCLIVKPINRFTTISRDVYERNKDIIEGYTPVKCNVERLQLIAKNAINAFAYNG